MRDVFQATALLLENYWNDLHSVGDETAGEKLAPLAGLNGVGGEGSLIQPIRLAPLVPGYRFGQHSLWNYQLARRTSETRQREDLQNACDSAGVAAMSAHLDVINQCLDALNDIAAVLERRCGKDAPPTSNTRNTLNEAAAAIRELAGLEAADEPSSPAEATDGAAARQSEAGGILSPHSAAGSVSPASIGSREEAFELLLTVARYFRRNEPHSPMSMALETLVRRGRMDFSDLLTELLPHAETRNAVLTAAGIQPETEKRNG